MRGVALAGVYLFGAMVAASLLAWVLSPWLQGSFDLQYEKILSRAVLLFCALGLVPLWRLAGLDAKQIDLLPAAPRSAVIAMLPGALLVVVPMAFFLIVEFRVWDDRVAIASVAFAGMLAGLAGSSLLVALFEEVLFRGLLFSAFRRHSGYLFSALAVSGLYAAVHFLGRAADLPAPDHVAWYTGIVVVVHAFANLGGELSQWDSFLSLFLLGLLFAWVREQHGLWVCIGLHAAFVFMIRLFKELTVRDVVNPYAATTGSYDNFVGHAVSVWLIFLFVVIALYGNYRRNLAGTG